MLELMWPYKRHAGVFAGTQQYAHERGWESIIDEFADDTIPLSPAQPAPYDGVIARATRKLARRAARHKLPVVNVWFSSPVWKSLPGVFSDSSAMGRLRAEHLLARGFRRFAALTSDPDRSQEVEVQAFAATVAEAGCTCLVGKVPLDPSASLQQWRKTERTIAAWMKDWRPPIGVYVGSEVHGRMVAEMCRNRGWRVPEDVAIVAGWNEEVFCEQLRPTLTSVEVGYERIGYEAARLLDRLMDGKAPPKAPILLPPQGLVVRESSDFFAVDDELVRAALEFIAANSYRPIGPDDVARGVAAETRTLQRRFRKFLDRSIAAEIRRVRIERAKRELAQSDRLLSEISRDVGFGEAMRMYEVFRRELGVTPSEYRQQQQSTWGL
jgi:LacI family transcriptional regulator